MSDPQRSVDDPVEVVKWYTRARRFPQLIGRTPDGATIWGGPYTYTQVAVGVIGVVVGAKTAWLWGRFGLIGNALVLLGVVYGLVLLVGRLPIGSRNPLSVAAGLLRALSAPAAGRVAGRAVRPARRRRISSRLVITEPPRSDVGTAPAPAAARIPAADRAPAPQRPPARVAAPALSGVQRLLAGRPIEES